MSTTYLHVNIDDIEDNFWDLNPQLKVTEPFKSLYKQDKDRFKKESSKIMFAIVMIYDPNSKYRNLSLQDRIDLLNEDFLIGKLKLPQEVIDQYIKLTQTPAQRNLNESYALLDKRTEFLKNSEYSTDNADKLDKLFANTANIYKFLTVAKAEVAKEQGTSSTVKGGQELSLADQGEI